MTPEIPPTVLTDDNPWPGLVSFSEADSNFFFGREREVDELARLVRHEPLIVLYGRSGLGKSSMLAAGLYPVLRLDGLIPIAIHLDYSRPESRLLEQVKERIREVIAQQGIEAPSPSSHETLWEYFHRRSSAWTWSGLHSTPVLVFDQFEEILTVGRDSVDSGATAEFLDELECLVLNRPPRRVQEAFAADPDLTVDCDFDRIGCRVLLSLREDFLADFETLNERLRSSQRNRLRLRPLTGAQALDAVLQPARHLLDEDLAIRIVDSVSAGTPNSSRKPSDRLEDQEVDPSILAVVLHEINRRRRDQGKELITAELIESSPTAEILKNFFERCLEGMPGVFDFVVDKLLTEKSGYRTRIAQEDASIDSQHLASLIERRLIRRVEAGRQKYLELTHDRLAEVARAARDERNRLRETEQARAEQEKLQTELSKTESLLHELRCRNEELQHRAEDDAAKIVEEFRHFEGESVPGAGARVADGLARLKSAAASFSSVAVRRALAIGHALGAVILVSYGHIKEAKAASDSALESASLADLPGDVRAQAEAWAYCAKGRIALEMGQLEEAESASDAAIERVSLLAQSRDDALRIDAIRIEAISGLAKGRIKAKRYMLEEAWDSYRTLLDRLRRKEVPEDTVLQQCQARILLELASNRDKYPQALPYILEAAKFCEALAKKRPDSLRWKRLVAEAEFIHGFTRLWDPSPFSETARHLKVAGDLMQPLHELDAADLDMCSLMTSIRRGLGMLSDRSGEKDKARSAFEAMEKMATAICGSQPDWVGSLYLLAVSYVYLAKNVGETEKAGLFEKARERFYALIEKAPGHPTYVRSAAICEWDSGIYHMNQGQFDAALHRFGRASELLGRLAPIILQRPLFGQMAGDVDIQLGAAQLGLGRVEDARAAFQRGIRAFEAIAKDCPDADLFGRIADGYRRMAESYAVDPLDNEAIPLFKSAIEAYDRGLESFESNTKLLQGKARVAAWFSQRFATGQAWEHSASAFLTASSAGARAFAVDSTDLRFFEFLGELHGTGQALEGQVELPLRERIHQACSSIEQGHLLLPREAESVSWGVPPLIPGPWRTLGGDRLESERRRLRGLGSRFAAVRRIRSLALSFYPGAELFEAEVPVKGRLGVFGYVVRNDEVLPITGKSEPLHAFNRALPPVLETAGQAGEFLRFFCASLTGEQGTFRLVDSLAGLRFIGAKLGEAALLLERSIEPMHLTEGYDGAWQARATVRYSNAVFNAVFRIELSGMVQMTGDARIASELPLVTEVYEDGIRFPTERFGWKAAREGEAKTFASRKQWAEAAGAQREVAGYVRTSETITESDRHRILASALLTLSWYQLLARDFSGGVSTTEEGLAVDPDLNFETNRAHALLLLGRSQEADALYRKHIGADLGNRTWEVAILDDLRELEAGGLSHPEFDRIRAIMTTAVNERTSPSGEGSEQRSQPR